MVQAHCLGFPRIGERREQKFALEAYWAGNCSQDELLAVGAELRQRHWQTQVQAGLDWVTVGDFSWYDQVLDTSALLGAVPERFNWHGNQVDLDTYFRMARGRAPTGEPTTACTLTKWFDTNYHYLVPEVTEGQRFNVASQALFDQVAEAQLLGHKVKPVLLGPLTWLWLSKPAGEDFDRLSLLSALLDAYAEILNRLAKQGIDWVQVDEPALVLDLPQPWRSAYEQAYHRLQAVPVKILLATYFAGLEDNLTLTCELPVAGIHIDAVSAPGELVQVADWLPSHKVLSVGLISGRNIWRTDLTRATEQLHQVQHKLGDRLWIAPSSSLLHVPVDLNQETELDKELRSWLSFAVQKLEEVVLLKQALDPNRSETIDRRLSELHQAVLSRRQSGRLHNPEVRARMARLSELSLERAEPFTRRKQKQQARWQLPLFPTTTIGSFPQTDAVRQVRRDFRNGQIGQADYERRIKEEISATIAAQEALGLDVLVHGEAERNDMVEYFGEQISGFAFTRFAWVQSYGSRCVKPPILYGDIERPAPMTVKWSQYAAAQTSKPMKGMLTGPVTILNWSFVRDDQPRAETARQLALALRDEVLDLEAAGIGIIQIDEAALREGLPLRKRQWEAYLGWAVDAFRLAASGAAPETQIHTHMCYSQFNDIIDAIARMDADVVTIETSRSNKQLLQAFREFTWPNDIGPGVYDIHSPNIPDEAEVERLLETAALVIPVERLWVNPDCGLKTRRWSEVTPALEVMVRVAGRLRERHQAANAIAIATA